MLRSIAILSGCNTISIICVGLNPEELKKTTYECLGPKSDYEKNRKNAVQKKPGKFLCYLCGTSFNIRKDMCTNIV